MEKDDDDPPEGIVQSPRETSELESLNDAITLVLCLLATAPSSGPLAPVPDPQLRTVYPDTAQATVRQMWLIEHVYQSEIWLDEAGEMWHIVRHQSPSYLKPINFALQKKGALIHCKALILTFIDQFFPPSWVISELQSLKDAITLLLYLLAIPPSLNEVTPRPESKQYTVYPDTDRTQERRMWLIERTGSSTVWLDEAGEMWHLSSNSPGFTRPIRFTAHKKVFLERAKNRIRALMTHLPL